MAEQQIKTGRSSTCHQGSRTETVIRSTRTISIGCFQRLSSQADQLDIYALAKPSLSNIRGFKNSPLLQQQACWKGSLQSAVRYLLEDVGCDVNVQCSMFNVQCCFTPKQQPLFSYVRKDSHLLRIDSIQRRDGSLLAFAEKRMTPIFPLSTRRVSDPSWALAASRDMPPEILRTVHKTIHSKEEADLSKCIVVELWSDAF